MADPTNTTIIRKAKIFGDLTEEQMKKIARIGEQRTCARGTVIVEEGSQGDDFYLVEEGTVEIIKNVAGGRRKVLTRLGPGDVFGELTLFDKSPRSASAVADGGCRLLVLSEARFTELLKEDPDVAFKVLTALLRTLYERIRTANEKVKEGIVWGFQVRL